MCRFRFIYRWIWLIALLTGCGGGAGGSDDPVPPADPAPPIVPVPAPEPPTPTANPGSFSTGQDQAFEGQLSARDSAGNTLRYAIVDQPTLGELQLLDETAGTFRYSPRDGRSGTDSFSFIASNGKKDSKVATVAIVILRPNENPIPESGCWTTRQRGTISGELRATDSDTPVAKLRYSLVADGSKGTVEIEPDGDFTYEPHATGPRGSDSFVFQVADEDGGSDTEVVAIIIDQKIMPLGDSITEGADTEGRPDAAKRIGYRRKLYNGLLDGNGYRVDFVGSRRNGDQANPAIDDPQHEGHSGWSAREILHGRSGGYPDDGVRAWLDRNPADIVLLHIGTNDFANTSVDDIEAILEEIDRWERANNPVTVVLARIIDRAPFSGEVTSFNKAVAAMAEDRTAAGDAIIVVDQQRALDYPDDMQDDLHPAQGGYNKMAEVWFEALVDPAGSGDRWSDTGPPTRCP